MFNDILKITKKCLKLWYVFVITLVVGVMSTFLSVKPLKTYSTSFSIKTDFLDRKKLWDEFYSWDIYNELKQKTLTAVSSNYFNDNSEEIKKALNITDEDIDFDVTFSISGSYSVLTVYSRSNDSDTSKDVLEYVKTDIVSYLEEKITESVAPEDTIPTVNVVSKSSDISSSINKKLIFGLASTVFVLFVELFVIAIIALCNKTIETDGDIESNYGAQVIVKDYEIKIKELETILNKNDVFKNKTLLISENIDYVSKKLKKEKLNYKELSSILNIEDFYDIEETAFVVEIVKGKTLKKDIEKLMKIFNVLNFKDVCFITRKEISLNENSSSK